MVDEESVAVCMPVNKLDPSNIIDGSVKKPCSECSQEVWISPVTLAMTIRIICIPCALTRDPKDIEVCIDPEQVKEMRSHERQKKLSGDSPN